jgi:hypothetical protein
MVSLVIASLIPLTAQALDHHTVVSVKPVPQASRVVGAKLTLTIHPDGNFDHARVLLTRIGRTPDQMTSHGNDTDHRQLIAGVSPKPAAQPYVHMLLEDITTGIKRAPGQMTPMLPFEREYTVHYGNGNDLKAGDRVSVVSAFNNYNNTYWHIYGAHQGPTGMSDPATIITLPGP